MFHLDTRVHSQALSDAKWLFRLRILNWSLPWAQFVYIFGTVGEMKLIYSLFVRLSATVAPFVWLLTIMPRVDAHTYDQCACYRNIQSNNALEILWTVY